MTPENATSVVKAVISLHNIGALASEKTIPVLFHLFSLPHKSIRLMIYFHIIKTLSKPRSTKKRLKNAKISLNNTKNNKIILVNSLKNCEISVNNNKNRINGTKNSAKIREKAVLRKFLAAQCEAENAVKAKKAIGILSELYRRDAWRDDETANVVAGCVFGRNSSAVRKAAWFLLGENFAAEDDDLDGEAAKGLAESQLQRVRLERKARLSSGRKERKVERMLGKIKKNAFLILFWD